MKIPEHEHTHSLYTRCLQCFMFGTGFPKEYETLEAASSCGNCGSLVTVKYYPGCCLMALIEGCNDKDY